MWVVLIGPPPVQMRAFGLKHTARALAQEHNVPLLPGTPLLKDVAEAREAAGHKDYPSDLTIVGIIDYWDDEPPPEEQHHAKPEPVVVESATASAGEGARR